MNMPSSNPANPYAPPQAEVRDAVAAEGTLELAGRGTRLGASMLDTLIWAVVVVPLFIGIDIEAARVGHYQNAFSPIGIGVTVLLALVMIAITTYLVHQNGQTPGKKVLGIKVVRSDFSRATLGRIFWLRNVVNLLPSLIPYVGNAYGLVDSLFIFNDRRQCVHDKIADTVVINA